MSTAPSPQKKSNKTVLVIAGIILVPLLTLCCVGGIAAVAIPAFSKYMRRAKTAEARAQLESLYQGAASYYAEEHVQPDGTFATGCTVSSSVTPNVPSPEKAVLGPLSPSFEALGFAPADPVYYQYEIVGVPGCGHPPGTPVYTFRARGDLDGDGDTSTFELTATAGGTELTRAPALARTNELE